MIPNTLGTSVKSRNLGYQSKVVRSCSDFLYSLLIAGNGEER